jgi:N-acetylglucosaminyldiphosphoundecaprenol N-acetyl-beta-D-mannosaminyltransferase
MAVPAEASLPEVRLETTPDGRVLLGGAELFSGDGADLLVKLDELVASDSPQLVVTPNVDHAINLVDQPDYARVYRNASLRLIDGAPVLWLARLLGASETRKFSGSDLIGMCAGAAEGRAWTVVMIGGDVELCREAEHELRKQYGHDRATFAAVPVPFLEDPADPRATEVVDALTELAPDIVFVCLGSPKQELWFEAWQDRLPAAVFVGAGATLDFVAGRKQRAPLLFQRLGLEWTWRLLQEPRRLWKRYLVKGPRFLPIAVRSWTNREKR